MKRKLLFAMLCIVSALGMRAQTWTGNEVQAGTFYLYNVAAEKFLNNGDPNQSWGTNAYLQAGFGMDIVLESAGGNAYNLNTNVSNGDNQNYLASSTWCDGNATAWTFRAVDGETNVYQIIYDGQYLMATEALNDVELLGDPGSRATSTYWKLVSEDDFKAAMVAKAYSSTDPMDVSIFIKGRSFARNDGRNTSWTTSHSGGNWDWIGASNNKYYGNESWNNTFDVHQSIAGLPDGTYEVQCSGFGTNGTTYIYGNSTSKAIQTDNTTDRGTNKAAKWIAIHEDNAFAGQSTGTFTIGDGNLTVGIKRETNTSYDWAIWDEFRLYYYGLDLSEFAAALADAVSAAEAVEGTVPTAAWTALSDVVTENNKTYTSASAYATATNAIIEATTTAKDLVANYTRYKNIRTAVLAINAEINVSAANTAVEAATTNDGIDSAVSTLRAALTTYLAGAGIEDSEIDLTDALIDNAAPYANADYWTVTNASGEAATPNAFDSGNRNAEFWNQGGYSIKQTVASLPVGYYTLTAVAVTRTGMNGVLSAGENTTNIVTMPKSGGTAGVDYVNNRTDCATFFNAGNGVNELTFNVAEAGDVTIGLTADNTTSDYWTVWRSFNLTYLGTAPLAIFQDRLATTVSAAEDHAKELGETIPAGVMSTYTSAISTAAATNTTVDECLQSIADIETATTAADAAVAPYAAYNTLRSAVQALYDVEDYTELVADAHSTLGTALSTAATNVSAATTAAAITEVTNTLKAAGATYNNGAEPTDDAQFNLTFLLTNPDLTGLPTWTGADGWYTDQTTGNSQVMTNDAATSEDGTKTAFYEYWTYTAQANNKFALYQKVTLPEGTYNISCYAFAKQQDDPANTGDKRGVKFYANDTEGSAVYTSRLSEASIEFVNDEIQEVKIGLKTTSPNSYNWMGIGYVTLTKTAPKTIAISEDVDYTPESAAGTVELTRTIKADTWNTFVVPFQINNTELKAAFGNDVEVAEFSEDADGASSTINFTLMDTPAISANTPVLLKTSTAGALYTFTGRTIAVGDAKVVGTNFNFQGSYDASLTIEVGDYYLSGNKVYKCVTEDKTTLKGTRAYFDNVAADAEVKAFLIDGDDLTTAISEIDGQSLNPANDIIYNLSGQRMSKAVKGVFIVNGKKVLVK